MALCEGRKGDRRTVLYERGINSGVRTFLLVVAVLCAWSFVNYEFLINEKQSDNCSGQVQTQLPSLNAVRIMSAPHAGVAKLVYALDSKSSEVHSSCRFESDLRHQTFTSS
jgi:hypothetical protein